MATIYERFNHLGLASSNKVLTKAGVTISNIFFNTHANASSLVKLKSQKEHESTYTVCDYPDDWTKELDRLILSFINNQDGKGPTV